MKGRRGWAGGAPVRSELASECRTGYGALQTNLRERFSIRPPPNGSRVRVKTRLDMASVRGKWLF